MKVYGKAGIGDLFSEKPLKSKIQIAQGERSRQLERKNLLNVLLSTGGNSDNLTFSNLLQETGLCRQSLAEHLRKLEKEGLIYKDTIKPWEGLNSAGIIRNAMQAWDFRLAQDMALKSGFGPIMNKPQYIGDVVYRMVFSDRVRALFV